MSEPATGTVVDSFSVGPVQVTVRYGCTRRDQYELKLGGPLPPSLREALAAQSGAALKGSAALYVVDVADVHQVTCAPAQGRIVVMPRLRRERAEQRKAVLQLCELLRGEAERA